MGGKAMADPTPLDVGRLMAADLVLLTLFRSSLYDVCRHMRQLGRLLPAGDWFRIDQELTRLGKTVDQVLDIRTPELESDHDN